MIDVYFNLVSSIQYVDKDCAHHPPHAHGTLPPPPQQRTSLSPLPKLEHRCSHGLKESRHTHAATAAAEQKTTREESTIGC